MSHCAPTSVIQAIASVSGAGVASKRVSRPRAAGADEPGALELGEVLGDGLAADRQARRDLGRGVGLAGRDGAQDGAARGVGKCGEDRLLVVHPYAATRSRLAPRRASAGSQSSALTIHALPSG